ncbi:hypothetical protein UPYG_G00042040, partial [Umbra pygmaea]
AHQALTAIMLDKRWLTQMKKFIHFRYQRTKTWGVYTVKENKLYSYIPDIQRAILSRRRRSGTGLPRKISLRPDDPRQLVLIAPVQPPPTSKLE